jgi:hypothetical protein
MDSEMAFEQKVNGPVLLSRGDENLPRGQRPKGTGIENSLDRFKVNKPEKLYLIQFFSAERLHHPPPLVPTRRPPGRETDTMRRFLD